MSEDQRIFTRDIPLDTVEFDGRNLDTRLVPYDTVATVSDGGAPYKEMFLRGAFDPQLRAANRVDVLLNFEHHQSIGDVVGRGTSLQDHPDGLYGTFRVLDHGDGDKALELVNAGVLTGMSIEFVSLRSQVVNGVTQRQSARIKNVALCRVPAYPEAKVLAVRNKDEADDQEDDQEREVIVLPPLLPPSYDRLAKFGVQQPRWTQPKADD